MPSYYPPLQKKLVYKLMSIRILDGEDSTPVCSAIYEPAVLKKYYLLYTELRLSHRKNPAYVKSWLALIETTARSRMPKTQEEGRRAPETQFYSSI